MVVGRLCACLPTQDVARAVHVLCAAHIPVATDEALSDAMAAATRHARASAPPAVAALLPADVPAAAKAAAGGLAVEGCLAAVAARLLQQVPLLVHGQLAQQGDQLVKVICRQIAVHARLTAAAPLRRAASGSVGDSGSSGMAAAATAAAAGCGVGALAAGAGSGCGRQGDNSVPLAAGKDPAAAAAQAHQGAAEAMPALATDKLVPAPVCSDATPVAARAARRIVPQRVDSSQARGGTPLGVATLQRASTASGIRASSPLLAAAFGGMAAAAATAASPAAAAGTPPLPPARAASLPLADSLLSPQVQLPFGASNARGDPHTPPVGGSAARTVPAARAQGLARPGSGVQLVGSPPLPGMPLALERVFAAAGDACTPEHGQQPATFPAAAVAARAAPPSRPGPQRTPEAVAAALADEVLAVTAPYDAARALALLQAVSVPTYPGGRADLGPVLLACRAAAHRCVEAVTQERVALAAVEECLLQLLAAAGAASQPAVPSAVCKATGGSGAAAGAGGAGAAGPDDEDGPQARAILLCGAAMHAWVTSGCHEAAVWCHVGGSGGDAHCAAGVGASAMYVGRRPPPGLQSFVQLPAAVMRVVRAGCGLGVLRQLRRWLQDATLGGTGGGGGRGDDDGVGGGEDD